MQKNVVFLQAPELTENNYKAKNKPSKSHTKNHADTQENVNFTFTFKGLHLQTSYLRKKHRLTTASGESLSIPLFPLFFNFSSWRKIDEKWTEILRYFARWQKGRNTDEHYRVRGANLPSLPSRPESLLPVLFLSSRS